MKSVRNTSAVLQAGGQVVIASDIISLDTSTPLSNVVEAGAVMTSASQILYAVSLVGPGQMIGEPGVTLSASLTILNDGPEPDTYALSRADSAGWSLGTLPSSITVEGLDQDDLMLNRKVLAVFLFHGSVLLFNFFLISTLKFLREGTIFQKYKDTPRFSTIAGW